MSSADRTERFVPGEGDAQTALEHLLRYELATASCGGRTVLDLACGDGYGAALVARTAKRVIGIDIHAATVDSAQTRYKNVANVEFEVGDAQSLELPDASVDCVLAFEMIEHVMDPERVVAEVRRILRPDGLLIISTPNAPENPLNLPGANPYHLHAFDRESFDALLAPHFDRRRYFGQRVVAAAALWPFESNASWNAVPNAEPEQSVEAALGDIGATYLVAVASSGEAEEVELVTLWKLDADNKLLDERIEFWTSANESYQRERVVAHELAEMTQHAREIGRAAVSSQSELAQLRASDARMRSALDAAVADADYLRKEALGLRESFESVVQSASWKLTRPLRRLRRSTRPE